jgi:hypothetical protein
MMNLLLLTQTDIPVRLYDAITNDPLVNSQYPLVHIYKGNTMVQITSGIGSNWKEIDPTIMPGLYYLTLMPADLDTLGLLTLSVSDPVTSNGIGGIGSKVFIQSFNVVRNVRFSSHND